MTRRDLEHLVDRLRRRADAGGPANCRANIVEVFLSEMKKADARARTHRPEPTRREARKKCQPDLTTTRSR